MRRVDLRGAARRLPPARSRPWRSRLLRRPERILVDAVRQRQAGRPASSGWAKRRRVLLTDDLNARGVSAITRPERQQAFERLQVPASAVLTDATVIRIAQLVGASQVVLRIAAARRRRPGCSRAQRSRSKTAASRPTSPSAVRSRDLFAIFDRLATRLALVAVHGVRGAGQAAEPEQPPIAGLRESDQRAARRNAGNGDQVSERGADRCTRPTIAPVWRCGMCMPNRASTSARWRRSSAVPSKSPWARRARFLGGVSQLALKQARRCVRDLQGARRRGRRPRPCSTTSASSSCGGAAIRRAACRRSTSNKAAKADPDDPDYFFNLGYAYFRAERDYPAAIYWLREAVRRRSGRRRRAFRPRRGAGGHGQCRGIGARKGAGASGCRRPTRNGRSGRAAEQVPKGLERVKMNEIELPHATPDRNEDRRDRAARSAGAGRVLSGSRPAVVRAGKRSRSGRRARSRAVSVAVPCRRPSAARPHPPAERPRAGGDRRAEDLAVERGDGRRPRRPGRRVPAGQRPGAGSRGGRAGAGARILHRARPAGSSTC